MALFETDAPAPEPDGYVAAAGFVKSNPDNNDYYVELWKDDPWYPAIAHAHLQIKEIAPTYNISQIKEKFGDLRYYYDVRDDDIIVGEYAYNDSIAKQRARIEMIVARAESWVAGYNYATRKDKG